MCGAFNIEAVSLPDFASVSHSAGDRKFSLLVDGPSAGEGSYSCSLKLTLVDYPLVAFAQVDFAIEVSPAAVDFVPVFPDPEPDPVPDPEPEPEEEAGDEDEEEEEPVPPPPPPAVIKIIQGLQSAQASANAVREQVNEDQEAERPPQPFIKELSQKGEVLVMFTAPMVDLNLEDPNLLKSLTYRKLSDSGEPVLSVSVSPTS